MVGIEGYNARVVDLDVLLKAIWYTEQLSLLLYNNNPYFGCLRGFEISPLGLTASGSNWISRLPLVILYSNNNTQGLKSYSKHMAVNMIETLARGLVILTFANQITKGKNKSLIKIVPYCLQNSDKNY